jgi:ssDNA-binding Zn-finger/Zn-ribbon topoisomerase 1
VARRARRGRRRGRLFYGCSRYPSCRGTRPFP